MNNSNMKTLHLGQLNFLNTPDSFATRLETLVSEIVEKDFDVICFQEIMSDKHEELENALAPLGFASSAYSPTISNSRGVTFGNAIFSKIIPTWFDIINFTFDDVTPMPKIPGVVARMVIDGQQVFIISAHFAWGGNAEPVRLRQATAIDAYAQKIREEHPDAIVLLTGDFNAGEESSTVRFLTGKQENHAKQSSYWVDAYELHGNSDNWVTSNPRSHWGRDTAHSVGIQFPEMIPARRIDYIMSYGWCYGGPGAPLSFDLFGTTLYGNEKELSDHYGLSSRILLSVT